MKEAASVNLQGREWVILPREEYERLQGLARIAEMPALPHGDSEGNVPAVEYARASIAREIILRRVQVDLSQKALAELAGVRVETLCRIENGRQTASTATVAKIDRALRKAEKGKSRPKRAVRKARKKA